jgi:hypothetical protein
VRVEIYGNATDADVTRVMGELSSQCKLIGLQLDRTTPLGPGRYAQLYFVFGNKTRWSPTEQQELASLVQSGQAILPVIDDAAAASSLPSAVAQINAFKKSDAGTAWVDSLVDEALGIAWLARRTRKVFISYRRLDCAPVASQIFRRFSDLGYAVFLDDATIDRGAYFQRELKWWLNDADLLLALCSPRIDDSAWCLEELSFAQSRSIGIVALEWPAPLYFPRPSNAFAGQLGWAEPAVVQGMMADQRQRLSLGDFAGVDGDRPPPDPDLPSKELTPEALERVVSLCARNRAAAIHGRLNDLLPLVNDGLLKQKAASAQWSFNEVTFENSGKETCFLRVLPFRPLPEHIYAAYNDAAAFHVSVCAYPESDPKDPRATALRWLADKTYLPAQTPAALSQVSRSVLWAFCGADLLP